MDKIDKVSINELANVLKCSKYVIAFTGAGISTESGIPDFRSVGGLYTSGPYKGHSPEQILSQKFFRQPENKPLFFSYYKERILRICEKEPNRSHFALKKLEDIDKLKWVVTQNIDNLHQKAGCQRVLDLHGNSTKFRCNSACGFTCGYKEFLTMLDASDIPKCECGGIVRPCTVLFDEYLDDETFDKAYYEIKKADLLIVVGSSLVVRPACTLVGEISDTCMLAILNESDTPYDKRADFIIRGNCGEALEYIVKDL